MRPPKDFSPEQVDAIVNSKRMWIYRHLAELKDLNASAVDRELVNGETFLYMGRSYRLAVVNDQDADILLKNGRLCIKRSMVEQEGKTAVKYRGILERGG